MVIEDLEAAGCTFTTRLEPHAEDRSLKVVEALARLHGRFWDDPRFDDELSWVQPAMRGSYGAKPIDNAREQFADEFPPVFTELCRLYVDNHERVRELLDDGERTLIHGDTHAGNQFADGDEVGLYDWAVISRSPGIRDVSIYLGNSCPAELRRSEQERWIHAYRQVLVDAGVDAPTFELLWERTDGASSTRGSRRQRRRRWAAVAAHRGRQVGHDSRQPKQCRPRDGRGV